MPPTLSLEFPTAAKIVSDSFYVDDGLTNADSIEEAISLQHQLQQLFSCGGFTLHKWNCSNPTVLELSWFSPYTIKMKILFQQLWEIKVNWDDQVPESVRESWLKWQPEFGLLSTKYVSRCYHDKKKFIASTELHGFSDASEQAYSAVVYLRVECTDGSTQVVLISSKTRVAPIKRLTIPRLELCGAQLLAQLLHHV